MAGDADRQRRLRLVRGDRGAHAAGRGPPASGRPRRRRRARGLRAAGGPRGPHRLRARVHALQPARPDHRHLRRLRLGDRRHRVRQASARPDHPARHRRHPAQRAHPRLLQGGGPEDAGVRGAAAAGRARGRRRRRPARRPGPRAERVGPVAPDRGAHRRPHAAADRHHLDGRALVGHPADGPDRRVDPSPQVRPATVAPSGGRRGTLRLAGDRGHRAGPDAGPRAASPPPKRRGCG